MQILKLLVAMCAMVSAQHDSSKCNSGSTGTNPCCYNLDIFAGFPDASCNDGYDDGYPRADNVCTPEESGSSS